MAWPDGNQVRTVKRLRSYGPVIEQALALYSGTDLPFFVHLRYNTVGVNSKANTHPFVLSPDLAMAHNKTLAIEPPHRQWSDSRTVAELLQLLLAGDPAFFGSPLFWSFIEHQAGPDNRLVFLDANNQELVIVNEHLGIDVGGLWFSNLYAWDSSTAGISHRSGAFTSKTDEQDRYQLDCWNYESDSWDSPLAWGAAGVDR